MDSDSYKLSRRVYGVRQYLGTGKISKKNFFFKQTHITTHMPCSVLSDLSIITFLVLITTAFSRHCYYHFILQTGVLRLRELK